MINNRQNGRRRGRGSGPRTPNQSPNPGNSRQDNRSRGNAAQLHEKYKSMARDAQMQGDRVQAEYYLQFADHYFRILNEGRVRFEEQRRERSDYGQDDEEDQDENGYAGSDQDDGDEQPNQDQRPVREGRPARDDRPRDDRPRDDRPREMRPVRDQRPVRADQDDRPQREEHPQRDDRPQRDERPQRDFRTERNGEAPRASRGRTQAPQEVMSDEDDQDERISLEVLPPAISADADAAGKPVRRRTRRPRSEDDIAPAA